MGDRDGLGWEIALLGGVVITAIFGGCYWLVTQWGGDAPAPPANKGPRPSAQVYREAQSAASLHGSHFLETVGANMIFIDMTAKADVSEAKDGEAENGESKDGEAKDGEPEKLTMWRVSGKAYPDILEKRTFHWVVRVAESSGGEVTVEEVSINGDVKYRREIEAEPGSA